MHFLIPLVTSSALLMPIPRHRCETDAVYVKDVVVDMGAENVQFDYNVDTLREDSSPTGSDRVKTTDPLRFFSFSANSPQPVFSCLKGVEILALTNSTPSAAPLPEVDLRPSGQSISQMIIVRYDIGFPSSLNVLTNLKTLTATGQFDDTTQRPMNTFDARNLLLLPSLTNLSLVGYKIDNIDYMRYLRRLLVLHIYAPGLQDLAPLQYLKNSLQVLQVSAPSGTDTSAIGTLKNLRSLDILDATDETIAPIKELKQLEALEVRQNNALSSYQFLQSLKDLKYLNLHGSKSFDNFDVLSGNQKLESVSLMDTGVSTLTSINLPNLRHIGVANTSISDLTPLAHMRSLAGLSISNTRVVDLRPLAHLPNLKQIDISETAVRDLSPLLAIRGLENVIATDMRDLSPSQVREALSSHPNASRLEIDAD